MLSRTTSAIGPTSTPPQGADPSHPAQQPAIGQPPLRIAQPLPVPIRLTLAPEVPLRLLLGGSVSPCSSGIASSNVDSLVKTRFEEVPSTERLGVSTVPVSPNLPTRLDEIKNFHAEVQVGPVGASSRAFITPLPWLLSKKLYLFQ